jgi:hypothetical protein
MHVIADEPIGTEEVTAPGLEAVSWSSNTADAVVVLHLVPGLDPPSDRHRSS